MRGWIVIGLVAALAALPGCRAMVDSYVKEKQNVSSAPFDYPEASELSPLASAIYTTIIASRDGFESYKAGPLPEAEKRAHLKRIQANMRRTSGGNRDSQMSAMQAWRKADFRDVAMDGLFEGTGYNVVRGLVASDYQLMAQVDSTKMSYSLSTESRAEAKRLAGKLAAELQAGPLRESAGWRWWDKQELMDSMLSGPRKAVELTEGTKREAQARRQLSQFKAKVEAGEKAGDFDSFQTRYQWYPGNINAKPNLTMVQLFYKDKALEVIISKMTPQEAEQASADRILVGARAD